MAAKASQDRYKYDKSSADKLVKTGAGVLHRIVVSASSSGVLSIYDGLSTSGTLVVDSLAVTAGNNIELNMQFSTGLHIELVSGTATWTAFYV